MKRVLLLMVISALLVTLGFAQTPETGSNTEPTNVKGCLGGSDGNYTVTQNGTRQVFKITTSSVDLKLHVGHDVKLIGHKTSGAASSDAAGNSLAVTDLSMISEHCAAAAAATVGAVVPYSQTVIEPTKATPSPSAPASTTAAEAAAPPATVSPSAAPATPAAEAVAPTATVSPSPVPATPAVDAAATAATVSPSAAPASTPTVEAAAPAATVSPAAAQISTPPGEATAPAATVSPSAADGAPSEKAAHSARRPAARRRFSATQDTAAAAPAATVSPTAADDATTVSPSPEVSPAGADAASSSPSATPVTPHAAATPPAMTHRTGSLSLLISFVVLVIVLGTLIPFIGRWRKRKMLERTGTPNLSFTNDASTNDASPTEVGTDEASSDQHKPEPSKVA